ncbi:MAG TPA: hypothetical protein DDZ80_04820 [Cyanobacteria bacterium UBA8803]|nr:hypothetical protein [Cyanobacteria bacterium UBA9273]HBL57879.1 hypothetical protein [Cyanobacteria bacterium UBA8803]
MRLLKPYSGRFAKIGSEFKKYIFEMLFLKRASDVFEQHYGEIKGCRFMTPVVVLGEC